MGVAGLTKFMINLQNSVWTASKSTHRRTEQDNEKSNSQYSRGTH